MSKDVQGSEASGTPQQKMDGMQDMKDMPGMKMKGKKRPYMITALRFSSRRPMYPTFPTAWMETSKNSISSPNR